MSKYIVLNSGSVALLPTYFTLFVVSPMTSTTAAHCRSLCLYKDTNQTTSSEKVISSCRASATILDTITHTCDRPAVTSP